MREIKFIGVYKRNRDKRAYARSLFMCPECGLIIEKIRKDGIKAIYCSHTCYAKNRKRRGNYNKEGYVVISGYKYKLVPEHLYCTKKGYVAEHRLVMEKHLGRFLTKDEIPHHIDENKFNNTIENLQLMTRSEHSSFHAKKRSKKNVKNI